MVVHVLGVLPTGRDLSPEQQPSTPPPTRTVSDEVLTAVVRDASEDDPPRSDDLLTHAHVLEQLVEEHTVVPFRFGMAVADDDAVRSQVLQGRREELTALLELFAGLQQVTVQVFLEEPAALREVVHRDPTLEPLRAAAAAPDSDVGTQVRLGQEVARGLEELAGEWRTTVLDRLAPLSRAVAEVDPAGQTEVIHVALLVERADRVQVDEAVGELRRDGEGLVRVRYVGPQPPYSFLEPARSGELSWA